MSRIWRLDVVIGGLPVEIWEPGDCLEDAVTSATARHGDVIPVRDDTGAACSLPNPYHREHAVNR